MAWDIFLFHTVNSFAGRFGGLDALGVFAAVFLLPLMVFLLLPAAFTVKRLREEHWYEMPVKALVAALTAYGARFIIAEFVGRPRPFVTFPDAIQLIPMNPAQFSFPSAHAALSFALAYAVWKHDRDWGIAFMILALLVAAGRVFVGVHFPVDVIFGALLGLFAGWLVYKFEHFQWSKLERTLRVR